MGNLGFLLACIFHVFVVTPTSLCVICWLPGPTVSIHSFFHLPALSCSHTLFSITFKQKDARAGDYLAPFLRSVADPNNLTLAEAAQVRQAALEALKVSAMEDMMKG